MKIAYIIKFISLLILSMLVAIFVERRYGFLDYFLSTRGIKTDQLHVNGETAILDGLVISAVYQTNDKRVINDDYYDTITIFKHGLYLNKWEPGYGKNWLLISICDTTINGPGHFKFSAWEKHDYIINITKNKNVYYFDWEIRGAYPMEGKSLTPFENCN